jgi:hypothetical protein
MNKEQILQLLEELEKKLSTRKPAAETCGCLICQDRSVLLDLVSALKSLTLQGERT